MNRKPHFDDQRVQNRFGIAMAITIDGEQGRTHDLSAQGVLLETQLRPLVGATVALGLSFPAAGRTRQLGCRGRVVRVEPHGDAYNVAVKLSEPLFS